MAMKRQVAHNIDEKNTHTHKTTTTIDFIHWTHCIQKCPLKQKIAEDWKYNAINLHCKSSSSDKKWELSAKTNSKYCISYLRFEYIGKLAEKLVLSCYCHFFKRCLNKLTQERFHCCCFFSSFFVAFVTKLNRFYDVVIFSYSCDSVNFFLTRTFHFSLQIHSTK